MTGTEARALFDDALRRQAASDVPVTTPENAVDQLSDVLTVLADRGFDIDSASPAVLVERAIGRVP